MTALLVGRLRELATQTHMLEMKVRNRGMMRFHRISPCPKCGGKVKAKWELDGVIGGYRFYLVLFRCTVCGFAFEGGCSFARDAHRLQRNIAAWNRICNGSEKFTLYESLGGRR